MGDDCASVGTSCQESILLLGVGVPENRTCKHEDTRGGGERKRRRWGMSQIGAKDKMNVYQHDSFSVNYA